MISDAKPTSTVMVTMVRLGAMSRKVVTMSAKPRTALWLALLWCAAIGGFALATSYPLALGLLFIAGFLSLAFNAMSQTLVQLHAPAAIRGRVIGFYNMAGLGLRAFSGVTVGLGGTVIGVHASLGASAGLLLGLIVGLLVFGARDAAVETVSAD